MTPEHSIECREAKTRFENAVTAVQIWQPTSPATLEHLVAARQKAGEAYEIAQVNCPADPLAAALAAGGK